MAIEDLLRHARELRPEGAGDRAEVEERFITSVRLLDPVVRNLLCDLSDALLSGHGVVHASQPGTDGTGGLRAEWRLDWPEAARGKDSEGGIAVRAELGATSPHGHLTASGGGMWPMAAGSDEDVERLRPLLDAAAESAMHECILRLGWEAIPAAR